MVATDLRALGLDGEDRTGTPVLRGVGIQTKRDTDFASLHDDVLEAGYIVRRDVGEEDGLEGRLFVYRDALTLVVLLDEGGECCAVYCRGVRGQVRSRLILTWGDDCRAVASLRDGIVEGLVASLEGELALAGGT